MRHAPFVKVCISLFLSHVGAGHRFLQAFSDLGRSRRGFFSTKKAFLAFCEHPDLHFKSLFYVIVVVLSHN